MAISGYTAIDAIKCYTNANKHIGNIDKEAAKAWVGAREGLGVGYLCFAGEGQVNGMPQAQYNEFGEEIPRTLDIFA